jgi:hypothetical protein
VDRVDVARGRPFVAFVGVLGIVGLTRGERETGLSGTVPAVLELFVRCSPSSCIVSVIGLTAPVFLSAIVASSSSWFSTMIR